MVSAKTNGKQIDVPAGTAVLKHVTPTDFVFVYHNERGLITVAGGGQYTREGDRYREAVQYGYGEGMAAYIGTTQVIHPADRSWPLVPEWHRNQWCVDRRRLGAGAVGSTSLKPS